MLTPCSPSDGGYRTAIVSLAKAKLRLTLIAWTLEPRTHDKHQKPDPVPQLTYHGGDGRRPVHRQTRPSEWHGAAQSHFCASVLRQVLILESVRALNKHTHWRSWSTSPQPLPGSELTRTLRLGVRPRSECERRASIHPAPGGVGGGRVVLDGRVCKLPRSGRLHLCKGMSSRVRERAKERSRTVCIRHEPPFVPRHPSSYDSCMVSTNLASTNPDQIRPATECRVSRWQSPAHGAAKAENTRNCTYIRPPPR